MSEDATIKSINSKKNCNIFIPFINNFSKEGKFNLMRLKCKNILLAANFTSSTVSQHH